MTLTASTTRADVIKPEDYPNVKDAFILHQLDPFLWLIIEEKTLKAIRKDARGYKLSLEKLNEAQGQHIKDKDRINELNLDVFNLQNDKYDQAVRIHELENPGMLSSPLFWGSVGVAVGIVVGVILGARAGN